MVTYAPERMPALGILDRAILDRAIHPAALNRSPGRSPATMQLPVAVGEKYLTAQGHCPVSA